MRERMWKPANPAIQRGEQGVPRGDGGRIDAADQGVPWCQTHGDGRLRKQLGRIVITFDVSPHLTDKLVRLGWLDATKRADKEGVATAGIAGVEKAISQSKPNRSYPRPDPCGYRERQVWGMRTRSNGRDAPNPVIPTSVNQRRRRPIAARRTPIARPLAIQQAVLECRDT